MFYARNNKMREKPQLWKAVQEERVVVATVAKAQQVTGET